MNAVLSVLLVASLTSAAPTVEERMARAQSLFEAEDYAGAAAELEAVYAEAPSPRVLVGWAQAEKYAGNCGKSLELYDRFLAENPPAQDVQKVQPYIDECRAEVEAESTTDPVEDADDPTVKSPVTQSPSPTTATEPIPTAPLPDEDQPRPWFRDPAGGALMGVGGAFTAAGIGLAVAASVHDARVDELDRHGEFEDGLDRALLEARLSYGAFAVGGALLIAGTIRYAVLARRHRRPRDVAVIPAGAGLAVHGRF